MIIPSCVRIACALSGGVDSTASAILLKQKGFQTFGVYMNNWNDDDDNRNCSNEDKECAKFVCNKLGIEFKELNFVSDYWNDVFCYFLEGYKKGETPNPDVLCNKHIKFGALLKYCIKNYNVDGIATGHYAGSSYGPFWEYFNGSLPVKLLRPKDKRKDQTLFLSQMTQESLKKVMFPLQYFLKSEVRKLVNNYGFENISKRPESTGICFIGKRNFKTFIEKFVEPKPGHFIDIDSGKIVGQHNGFHYWTLGERCGIQGYPHKYFIAKKIQETNDILVAAGTNHPSLFSDTLITQSFHWICKEPIELQKGETYNCLFKFQHVDQPKPCTVTKLESGSFLIRLMEPQRALTPGQFAVLYDDDECIGSSIIAQHFTFSQHNNQLKQLVDTSFN